MIKSTLAAVLLIVSASAALAQPCNASSTALCLSAGRFEVKVAWTDFQGNHGDGQAIPLTADTGYFWFFTNTNVELVVKVLDARGVNGHFWVFYGALSNVQYELTVRDSQTGDVQVYDNPSGQFASVGDTLAFPPSATVQHLSNESRAAARAGRLAGRPVDESRVAPAVWNNAAACAPAPTALCLSGGRFRVEAAWKDFQGNTGAGQAIGLTGDTGYFWFFSSTNVEAVVKVLDGRPINNHVWVFYGALSNVQYVLTVTDTVTGIVKTYKNPSGLFASVGDTLAFGTPTTFQLIDGAVVKGEIDAETALLYKIYAFFGDPRVPQAYLGTRPGERDHGIVREVVDQWPTLSPATRQLLMTYLAPPTYAGSWFAGGSAAAGPTRERSLANWTKISTARSWVWYRPADVNAETAANNLAAEIENIWTQETGLMGKEPKSDAGAANNGGDGKLDIYVLPSFRDEVVDPNGTDPDLREALGVAMPYLDESPTPSYILIRASYASTIEGARDVLAHEFFHAISSGLAYKIPSANYAWMDEATATWMEDYVYPTQIKNLEQVYAPDYFDTGFKESLDYPSDHGYSEYLFFFYLAGESRKTAAVNAAIWGNVASMEPWQAIDTAIPGGFKARWPEFAIDCWNQNPVDQFKQWDKLNGFISDPDQQIEPETDDGSEQLGSRHLEHLAMSFAIVRIPSSSKIKRLEIQNQQLSQPSEYAKTQAWIYLADGTARVEDWTNRDRVVFCRDKASQNVRSLLILYTNSNPDPVSDELVWNEGKVKWNSFSCGYQGTVHATRHFEDDPSCSSCAHNHVTDETVDTTDLTFVQTPGYDIYSVTSYAFRYVATERTKDSQGQWCTETIGPASTACSTNCGVNDIQIISEGPTAGTYWGEVDAVIDTPVTNKCPGGSGPGRQNPALLYIPADVVYKVNSDGSLTGTWTGTLGGGGQTYAWDLWTFTWSFKPEIGDEP